MENLCLLMNLYSLLFCSVFNLIDGFVIHATRSYNIQIGIEHFRYYTPFPNTSSSRRHSGTLRMSEVASMKNFDASGSLDSRDPFKAPLDCVDHVITCNLAKEWEGFSVRSINSSCLSKNERQTIFTIFEKNMKQLYVKNAAWHEAEKKKELFHPDSRFLCVYASPRSQDTTMQQSAPSSSMNTFEKDQGNEEIIAFVMFRFEWDDEDEPEHPVVFCYEIQICENYRGRSLGKHVSYSHYH